MEQLTSRDLRALLHFLHDNYIPRDFNGFIGSLLSSVKKVVPVDMASYHEMNPATRVSIDWWSDPERAALSDFRWPPNMHEHEVLTHFLKTRDGHALKMSDFLTQSQFYRTSLYNEFYRPMGLKDDFCYAFPYPLPRVMGIGLKRTSRTFSEKDRLKMNIIRPHLIQGWRNAKTFTKIQAEMKSLGRTLDQLDRGVVILDARGRVRLMTPRARRLLVECFGQCEEAGRLLPTPLQLWLRHSLTLVDAVGSLEPRVPLVIEREGKQVEFRLMTDSSQILLLIGEYKSSSNLAALRRLGLTQREAEVLAWVAEGKTNTEVATILGLSPRTVQKHMEHVTTKLGVETRTAAARIALRVTRG